MALYFVNSKECLTFACTSGVSETCVDYKKKNNMTRRKLRTYIIIGVLIVFVVAVASMTKCSKVTDEPRGQEMDTTLVLIQQVKECARLYTASVAVHKIVTHDDVKSIEAKVLNTRLSLDLPLAQRKIAIPIDATVKAYIDFADFSEDNVKRYGDKVEIILPDPKVVLTQTKVKNEDIKKQVSLLRSDFTDEELTMFEAKGREDIIAQIPKMNIMSKAEEGAAKVLVPLMEQLGFKDENITITFRKEFSLGELKRMIVND